MSHSWYRTLTMVAALLLATPSCSRNEEAEFDRLLSEGAGLYARGKEELIIRHFFRDRRGGFFLDVGCYLPKKNNTTYYLEHHLGWTGIAVDAQDRLGRAWKKERPGSRFFAYAVSNVSGERVTFYQAGGLSSLERENIDKWERQLEREIEEKEIHVSTITLNDLLDREGVTKVDFLSLDINGTEPIAMEGFDIRRFGPELVHIEVHDRNEEVLRRYFAENGYERIDTYLEHDKTNWYFAPSHR